MKIRALIGRLWPGSSAGRSGLLLLPALIFLGMFYLVPLVQIVWLSFQDSTWPLEHYSRIFLDRVQLEVLGNTLGLSAGVAALTLLLGYPVAYLLVCSGERLRRVLFLIILASVWISILVRTYAWMVLLGRQGPVNSLLQTVGLIGEPLTLLYNDFSVYVGMVHIMLPFMILPLYSVMQRIDLRLMSSARSLGAAPWQAFWFIFVPLSLPGVLAGTLLVFIISIGFFITPALLGGIENTTFVMLIEQEVNRFLNWELAAAMSIVLLVSTLALVAIYQTLLNAGGRPKRRNLVTGSLNSMLWKMIRITRRSSAFGPISEPSAIAKAMTRVRRIVFAVLPWAVIAFLLVPLLIIIPLSFSGSPFLEFPPSEFSLRWYQTVFARPDWTGPILTSLRVAFAVMLMATPLGLLAAVSLARNSFRFKSAVTGFLMSPMIVPVMVLAVAMYRFSSQLGATGSLSALIVGHVVLALPFVLVVMNGALVALGEDLEKTAQTLGASPAIAFMRVTLPLLRPAVLTSALFAFLVSFDELVIALFLAGPTTKTLPKRLWEAVREEIDPATAAVAVLITGVCLVAMLVAEFARSRAAVSATTGHGARGEQALNLRRRGVLR